MRSSESNDFGDLFCVHNGDMFLRFVAREFNIAN